MSSQDRESLLQILERLEAPGSELPPQEAEKLYMQVLEPLLADDEYDVRATRDGGFDFVATRLPTADHQGQILGIQWKYFRSGQPVDVSHIRELIGGMVIQQEMDRAILLANTRFTKLAHQTVQRALPLQIELLDLDALRAWTDRVHVDRQNLAAEVREILQVVSRKFAAMIAKDPRVLDEIEWRDLERTIAEVFEGIGFSVTLTRPSKDGGKDVILVCQVQGEQAEYIVEIKHWRSGKRVGRAVLLDFVNVIVREGRKGGLFLFDLWIL